MAQQQHSYIHNRAGQTDGDSGWSGTENASSPRVLPLGYRLPQRYSPFMYV